MKGPFYSPRPRRISEEEARAKLFDRVPVREPTADELKALQRLHVEVEEGIRYAQSGDVPMANSTYAFVMRKALGMEYNNGVLRHLDELKSAMNEALDRRMQGAKAPEADAKPIQDDHSDKGKPDD